LEIEAKLKKENRLPQRKAKIEAKKRIEEWLQRK